MLFQSQYKQSQKGDTFRKTTVSAYIKLFMPQFSKESGPQEAKLSEEYHTYKMCPDNW